MLARANRLTSERGFASAIRRGRRAGTPTVVLHLGREESQMAPKSAPRVGLVVSKAVGPAVVRNRVKRRLRHVARERLHSLPLGCVVVIRALPAAASSSSAALGRDVDSALGRLLGGGHR